MRRVAVLLLTGCFGAPPDVGTGSESNVEPSSGSPMGSSEDSSSSSASGSADPTTSVETSAPSTDSTTASTGQMGSAAVTGEPTTGQDCAVVFCGGVGAYGNCEGVPANCDCGECAEPAPGHFTCAAECMLDCECEQPNTMDTVPRCIAGHCFIDCTGEKPCPPDMMCLPSAMDPTISVCTW